MITDDELLANIEKALDNFEGDLTEFYTAVGLVVVGRLMGWKVMRLVSTRKQWDMANRLFGDIKQPGYILRERDRYAYRSKGLAIADSLGNYWDYIKGHCHMPLSDRRGMK